MIGTRSSIIISDPNLIVLSQRHFPISRKKQAILTLLLLGGIILTAITGVLPPALSIPLAAVAVLLLGCIKVTDTYQSVNRQAVATVGGMMSLGLGLEKTGAPREHWVTPWSPSFKEAARI